MAVVKPLKIGSDGIPVELNGAADELQLVSFQAGNGPKMSATSLDLATQPITAAANISFTDPTTAAINPTAGSLIIDDIMAKDRVNAMDAGTGQIQFSAVTDAAGPLSSLSLPSLAGAPTAAPTAGAGSIIYDTSNKSLWIYDGVAWDDQSTVSSAETLSIPDYVAGAGGVAARDIVYVSAADTVLPAPTGGHRSIVGFAKTAAAAAAAVAVVEAGKLVGFSGLTAGDILYASATVVGGYQTSVPTGTGQFITQLGIAKNASTVQVQVQQLGKRV